MGKKRKEAVINGIQQFTGKVYDVWQFRVQTYLKSVNVRHAIVQDAPESTAEAVKFK